MYIALIKRLNIEDSEEIKNIKSLIEKDFNISNFIIKKIDYEFNKDIDKRFLLAKKLREKYPNNYDYSLKNKEKNKEEYWIGEEEDICIEIVDFNPENMFTIKTIHDITYTSDYIEEKLINYSLDKSKKYKELKVINYD